MSEARVIDDAAWERMAHELPPNDRTTMRNTLEIYAREFRARQYIETYMRDREVLKLRNRAILDAARVLLKEYDGRMAWRDGLDLTAQSEKQSALIAALSEVVENAENNLRQLSKPGPKRTKPRNVFLRLAIGLWQSHGGKVTTVTDYHTNKATGPLERYLVAVSALIGQPITAEAAQKVVQSYQQSQPPME